VPLKCGSIRFLGESLTGMPVHQIVQKGVSQSPEGRGIFLNLSVEENLDLGTWSLGRSGYKTLEADLARIYDLFPRLKERRRQNAGTLSGGEQQMLAMGRALMAHPKLLLLDEPSLGLAPLMIETIFEIIQAINKEGMTILLVEQNARKALQIAHEALVLETGHLVAKGPASELLRSDLVQKAYLGEGG
jgi:branched-chain amino acid transport system ATP-binding protein